MGVAPDPELPSSNPPYHTQQQQPPPPPPQPYVTDTSIPMPPPNYPSQSQQPPPYYPSQTGATPTYAPPPEYTQTAPQGDDSKFAWVFLFVGIFVGLILDFFGFCFLFCMGNNERTRKKRFYFAAGVTIGAIVSLVLFFTVFRGRLNLVDTDD